MPGCEYGADCTCEVATDSDIALIVPRVGTVLVDLPQSTYLII